MSDRTHRRRIPGSGAPRKPYGRGRYADQRPFVEGSDVLCLVLLAALVAGCAGNEEQEANATFGDSVRRTIALQTAPPGAPGTGLDAVQAQAALDAYRKDVGERKKIEKNVVIKVGE